MVDEPLETFPNFASAVRSLLTDFYEDEEPEEDRRADARFLLLASAAPWSAAREALNRSDWFGSATAGTERSRIGHIMLTSVCSPESGRRLESIRDALEPEALIALSARVPISASTSLYIWHVLLMHALNDFLLAGPPIILLLHFVGG